jgi:LPXTG-motif cell wall-anchored protein
MGGKGSIAWKVAGVAALVVATAVAGGGSASAGQPATITGVAACDTGAGEQVVTWTFHNFTNDFMDIQSATLDATGLTIGSSFDTTVSMSPATNILSLQDSIGSSAATGDATGPLVLNVTAYQANIDTFVDFTGSVTLTGACEAAVTTTAAPTTVAPVTTLTGAGGGSLPASGNGSTLPIVAGLITAAGAGMLLLRRRTLTN